MILPVFFGLGAVFYAVLVLHKAFTATTHP